MAPNLKYLQTARLGEGVIYVLPSGMVNDRKHHAAIIVKQHDETTVDLLVLLADGTQKLVMSVTHDTMAERPGSWAHRPKT